MLRANRFFAKARDARQKSLVQEAGAACRIVYTPPHVAEAKRPDARPLNGTFGLLTVTQEPSRNMLAHRPALPMLRTGRLFAEARGARQKSLVQEAGTACSIVWTPAHAAEASSSRGCRKQLGLPAEGPIGSRWLQQPPPSSRGWARRAATNKWFRPSRAYSRVGTRRWPKFPDGSKLPPAARRRVAATSRDRVSKKAGKTWTMWNVAGFFLGKKPRENFPDVECDRGVFQVTSVYTKTATVATRGRALRRRAERRACVSGRLRGQGAFHFKADGIGVGMGDGERLDVYVAGVRQAATSRASRRVSRMKP